MSKPMTNTLFIDGFSLIFRAYYSLARNPMKTQDGRPTSAIFGFTSMLVRLLQDHCPTQVLIALDSGKQTFRRDKYAEYKANRAAAPEDLVAQLDAIFELIDAFGIKKIAIPGFEADDIIGTCTKKLSTKGIHSLVVSGDKDLFQLLDDQTSMLYVTSGIANSTIFDPLMLQEKYQLEPNQIPDYKGLAGDSSDNIPGVKGIGDKGAIKLLNQFSTLDNLYQNLADLGKTKQREKLEEGRENAFLSKELATIHRDMEIDEKELDFQRQAIDFPRLEEFFNKYEISSLMKRVYKLEGGGIQGWFS